MKTTLDTRESLREMAATVAVKGPLLIELLDDIAELRAALTALHTRYNDRKGIPYTLDNQVRVALAESAKVTPDAPLEGRAS